ncbi:MAG: DNA polymerase III subunit alpha [Crocinitomicaceae bacterium]
MKVQSCYSLKYGVLQPEALVEWALESRYPFLLLADINSTGAALSFVRSAQEKGVKAVIGVELRNDMELKATIIARNNRGFHELNVFLSRYLHGKIDFPDRIPHLSNCYVSYPFPGPIHKLNENEYIDIQVFNLTNINLKLSNLNLNKLLVLPAMAFRNQCDYNTHRLLRAIHYNTLLSKLERSRCARDGYLMDFNTLKQTFDTYRIALDRTVLLLEDCGLAFDFSDSASPQNPTSFTVSEAEDELMLRNLCLDGLPRRYKELTDEIVERIEREIEIIAKKKYLSYFLMTWDFTSYARSRNYFYVGRGSGANSIVAYLLRITNVDPLELDLYFERFINLERKSPPDFDIDFSWRDRDDVIRYIFEKYPTAALLCTYNTFQYRATIRELGKVFGLPKSDIGQLAIKHVKPKDSLSALVLKYGECIQGLPSHLSVHSGGIVISEKPMTWFSATFLPPKGFPTTQFSMLEAEDVGLYKFDVLSQRGLAKIQDGVALAIQNQPDNPPRDINDLDFFKKDPLINALLTKADALGCFYVESPAMRMLMTKLSVKNYLELVAASSVIRPGVSQSGMMRTYILRHRFPEERKKAHPLLLKIMPETYGVMVYQEDVIKVAHYFAGLTLGESDVLRRGMSGKFRSRSAFLVIKEKFFQNCGAKGYGFDLIKSVWTQIESFAGYAFAKGHSASYAVESYQSLYLKAYYPLEYMTACINNFGGYYRTEFYIHEARMLGARVEAPCIQRGAYGCVLDGRDLILGFNLVNGVERNTILSIVKCRSDGGQFARFEDLLRRVYIPFEQLILLIRMNALRDFGIQRKALLWRAYFFHDKKVVTTQSLLPLEAPRKQPDKIPTLDEDPLELDFEYLEYIGFSLCSPFDLLKETIGAYCTVSLFPSLTGRVIQTYGYLVALKNTKSSKGNAISFGMFLDPEGKAIDTVHFHSSLERFPFSGLGIYCLKGKIVSEFDFYCIEVSYMKKQAYIEDPRFSEGKH